MPIRKGHGAGKGTPHVEVSPADELPRGIPDVTRPNSNEGRVSKGRFAKGNPLAAVGGRTKKGSSKLAIKISYDGLANVSPGFRKYSASAERFRRVTCADLARDVGNGYCGPAVSAIVKLAAQALAASQYFYDVATSGGGDPEMFRSAVSLGEKSRQHLLAAHELCARQAKDRPIHQGQPAWLVAINPSADEPANEPANESESDPKNASGPIPPGFEAYPEVDGIIDDTVKISASEPTPIQTSVSESDPIEPDS